MMMMRIAKVPLKFRCKPVIEDWFVVLIDRPDDLKEIELWRLWRLFWELLPFQDCLLGDRITDQSFRIGESKRWTIGWLLLFIYIPIIKDLADMVQRFLMMAAFDIAFGEIFRLLDKFFRSQACCQYEPLHNLNGCLPWKCPNEALVGDIRMSLKFIPLDCIDDHCFCKTRDKRMSASIASNFNFSDTILGWQSPSPENTAISPLHWFEEMTLPTTSLQISAKEKSVFVS